MSGFLIDLGGLSSGPSRVRAAASAQELGLSEGDWIGRIVGDFGVERNGDRISIRGSVQATARLECVRCLDAYTLPLEAPLEVFAERGSSGKRADEEELERDDYMLFHDGRRLDLSEEAREALLLEVPIAPHCREDCRGLCPRCGADLNQGPCRCESAGAGATARERASDS
jgi:uncharacterized protein